jgi:DNA-binding helix-hairpin-helix protein with protein kinase domain
VAKVYHKPSAYKAEKLSAMAQGSSPDLIKIAAWPTATLHQTRNGPVAGFMMPKVSGQEIRALYGPLHRRNAFPRADWAFLVHTAMNCAIAFDVLHGKKYVMGDVNQGNVLVSPQALVYLIDCDSFQSQANGRLFLSEVGVAQYTPPELQEANFRQEVRTANHYRFGLAVLIFHLLCMGRHPFAGRFLGKGEMLLEQAIKEFRFVYGRWAARVQMSTPPFSLTLDVLSPELANLFDRAFRPGSQAGDARPTAAEWRSALTSFQKELTTCPADSGHKIPRHHGKCPWCEIMRAGGPNFFIGVAVVDVVFSPDHALLSRLWAQVESVPGLSFVYDRPSIPSDQPIEPTVVAADLVSDKTAVWAVGFAALAGMSLLMAGICLGVLAAFGLPIVLVFGVWWLVLVLNSPRARVKRQKHREWRAATAALEYAEAECQEVLTRSQQDSAKLKAALVAVRDQFRNLKAEYDADRRRLEQNKNMILLNRFLETKFISDGVANKEISGIGPTRLVLLESNGIETACDISEDAVMAIRRFGPVLMGKLLDWKHQMAAGFRFDSKAEVPRGELMALTQKYKQKQDLLRAKLERGVVDLQGLSQQMNHQLASLRATIQRCVIDVAQAETDMAVLV